MSIVYITSKKCKRPKRVGHVSRQEFDVDELVAARVISKPTATDRVASGLDHLE